MPSAINTFFGWVFFGKIQGSNVADMANFTIKQDVMGELTGTRRSYVAVLTADKNSDLWYL